MHVPLPFVLDHFQTGCISPWCSQGLLSSFHAGPVFFNPIQKDSNISENVSQKRALYNDYPIIFSFRKPEDVSRAWKILKDENSTNTGTNWRSIHVRIAGMMNCDADGMFYSQSSTCLWDIFVWIWTYFDAFKRVEFLTSSKQHRFEWPIECQNVKSFALSSVTNCSDEQHDRVELFNVFRSLPKVYQVNDLLFLQSSHIHLKLLVSACPSVRLSQSVNS